MTNWGGIEWEPAEATRPSTKWSGVYQGAEVYLYHRSKLWTAKAWDCIWGWVDCARWHDSGYKTRREAIEGIKVVMEFLSGKSVGVVALDVVGCTDHVGRVEQHLRRWL